MPKSAQLKQLESLIEGFKKEAYRRGWDDALHYIIRNAKAVADAPAPATATATAMKSERAKPRAKRGSVPRIIKRILRNTDQDGLTTNEIFEHARAAGKNLAPSSVRTTLPRLQRQGHVRKDGKHWFLTQRLLDVGQKDAGADAPAPNPPNKGATAMPPP